MKNLDWNSRSDVGFCLDLWQKKEGAKNEGEKKAGADAGAKKDDGMTTVVLKLDMHCEGCAKKVKRAVRSFDGIPYIPNSFTFSHP